MQGSDAKYFQTTKKGEIHELKSDLNSNNKDKIKDAVKKVFALLSGLNSACNCASEI